RSNTRDAREIETAETTEKTGKSRGGTKAQRSGGGVTATSVRRASRSDARGRIGSRQRTPPQHHERCSLPRSARPRKSAGSAGRPSNLAVFSVDPRLRCSCYCPLPPSSPFPLADVVSIRALYSPPGLIETWPL